jgi:CheY-like chemotaxis protein
MSDTFHTGYTILVVEDDAWIRTFLRDLLVDEGYRVLEAADGRNGLRLACSHMPDLILLDLAMPRMSGLDVLRELKRTQQTRHTPVLVLSAFRGMLDQTEAGGPWRVLHKPLDVPMLLEAIGHALRSAELV